MKNRIKTSIVLVTIILLVLFCAVIYRLNSSILFASHKQIDIALDQEFQKEDILNILKEVSPNKKVEVQKLEVYEDMVSISISDISDEELENLNTKINEKYGTEHTKDDIKVTDVPKVNFVDFMGQYIKPFFISLTLIVIYVAIYSLVVNKINK